MKVETLLSAIRVEGDPELRRYVTVELTKLFGKENAEKIISHVLSADAEEGEETEPLSAKAFGGKQMVEKIESARREKQVPESSFMDMYHSGDPFLVQKSKDIMVKRYTNFIWDIIHDRFSTYGKEYWEEMHQGGVEGALIAMKNYDVKKNTAFTTFSFQFIVHGISQVVSNDTVYFRNIQRKIADAVSYLTQNGFDVTVENVALLTELKTDLVDREMALMASSKFVRLDSEEAKEIPSPYESSPDSVVFLKMKHEELYTAVSALDEMDRRVLEMMYLDDDEKKPTIDSVARDLGISPSQVKQCKNRGLEALRSNKRLRAMCTDYLEKAEAEMLRYSTVSVNRKLNAEERLNSFIRTTNEMTAERQKDAAETTVGDVAETLGISTRKVLETGKRVSEKLREEALRRSLEDNGKSEEEEIAKDGLADLMKDY